MGFSAQSLQAMVGGRKTVDVDDGVGWLNNKLSFQHFFWNVFGYFVDVQTHNDV